jgi:hypothetical protein
MGTFLYSKLHFHIHVNYIFSHCMELLGLVHSVTFALPSLECTYICILYYTGTLHRYELKYVFIVWNSTTTDANKQERI